MMIDNADSGQDLGFGANQASGDHSNQNVGSAAATSAGGGASGA